MKRTRMNKVVCLFAASASFAAFGLTDVYWVGGETGNWNDTANWACSDWVEPNKPNSVDCIVHITNEVPVKIAIPSGSSYTVGGIYFSGADHTITSGNNQSYLIFGVAAAGQTNFIDVAQGVTATVAYVMGKNDNWSAVFKTGDGTLDVVGRLCKSTNRFKSLEIVEGAFRYNDTNNYGSFRIAGVCTVRSGAKFVNMGDNRIFDGQVINLEKGAVFDSNGKYAKFGGITGYGVVTNLGKSSSYWYAGPLDFSGQVYGPIVLSPRTNYVENAEGCLCVGASDTLANSSVTLAGDAAYTNVLRFAPGVGSFEIQSLDFGTNSHSVVLADTDGDPISLKIGDVSIIGAANQAGTAVLDLQDGVMEVKENFKQPSSGTISSPAEGKILFNGGVLRAVGSGNQSWWTGTRDPDDRVKAYVGAAGATIDVQAQSPGRSVTVGWPFVSDVENGVDGGLVKLGLGQLVLSKPYAATGFVDVREGGVSAATSSTAAEFGAAGVRIGSGHLKFTGGNPVTVSAASGASLSYTNCATLALSSGVALTVGPSDAAVDSAIVREGHGVLMVMSGTANVALNDNATSVVVNGGLSNDASTGLLRQPIFERRQSSSGNPYRARFLACAANNRLVPVEPVEFDPASSTSATVAKIMSSGVTVSANASVGALVVELSYGAGLTNNATLSVGQNAAGTIAPILLNGVSLNGSQNAKPGISGSGTIDFGASEGLIVLNGNSMLLYPVNIDNAIAGSGGVTFAAPTLFSSGIRGHVVLNKASTYTGGTWIENAHVVVWKVDCIGTGTVHVFGSESEGGALEISAKYDSITFTNSIEIAGNGPAYSESVGMPRATGALIVRKGGVTLSGGLTLVADAKIASGARGGPSPVTFSAPIVGPGKLTVSGSSPFRFAAANTYAGGTVITNGTVEVTDAGTLGSGPVKVCAGGVLRYVNTSAKTVSNVISGDGRIEMNGAAVTLSNASGFSGDVAGDSATAFDDGYVKAGSGTVSLTNALAYAGATTVSAGTLRLGSAPLGVPAASESIAFHLDASAGDTITEEDGAVVSWSDADGRGIAFTNEVANAPSRVIGAKNGLDALYFNGEKKRRLIANAVTPEFCTVFFVNCVTNINHPTAWSNMGIFGELDTDKGLRFYNRTSIKSDSMFFDGILRVDGNSSAAVSDTAQYDYISVTSDKFLVTEAEVAVPVQNATFAIGDYLGSGRSYLGDIAEVIAYDRWLTDEERIATERYLQNKWGLKEVAANGVLTNVLPVATALTVAGGATLDLAGGYQQVASLSGAGTIANSFETQATLVLSSGTSEFSGSFSGDIYLEVAADATLNLCGGTITVAGVRGSGRICNGTVVVTGEIQPGGRGAVGTLTFETAPVVAAGATLVVDGDGAGGVDKMAVEGAFDMTGLSLSVPAPRSVAPGDHAVVESGVALSGEFYTTDLPADGRLSVGYTAQAAVLSRKLGLIMIMR